MTMTITTFSLQNRKISTTFVAFVNILKISHIQAEKYHD